MVQQVEFMTAKPTICAIVPAKGHSTRLPGKNLKDLCGKPMLAYILQSAKAAKGIDRVIVSTDSQEVKKVAEQYGADVPFIRPAALTEDQVSARDVLQHALDELEKSEGYAPDYVLLLFPTSPLLKPEKIEEAIEIAIRKDSDSVVSGSLDKGHYWREVEGGWVRLYPEKQVNSQWQVPLFVENGAIYLTKSKFIKRQYVADKADIVLMERDETIDVDHAEDFAKVERLLRERNK
jgi:CMP-N,N'-diacetyllegionaminic acid synthase